MWKLCAAFFALSLSGSGLAQQSLPSTNQQEIIVQGTRNRDQALRQFIRAVTVAEPNYGQLGRFELPACPYVVGLGQSQDQMVASRIREVADAVGIETGNQRCKPNVFVIVADDKKATIKWLEHHAAALLLDANNKPITIPNDDSPAAGWHVLGMRDDAGRDSSFFVFGSVPSRIRPVARPHFLASVLVVESRALGGLTTTELADYAAMRAFAQLDSSKLKQPPAPTILTILDAPMGAAVPMSITNWDLAFLRGLYASSLNRYAAVQQSEIRRTMEKELAKQGEH
jgi:hypothetical protein